MDAKLTEDSNDNQVQRKSCPFNWNLLKDICLIVTWAAPPIAGFVWLFAFFSKNCVDQDFKINNAHQFQCNVSRIPTDNLCGQVLLLNCTNNLWKKYLEGNASIAYKSNEKTSETMAMYSFAAAFAWTLIFVALCVKRNAIKKGLKNCKNQFFRPKNNHQSDAAGVPMTDARYKELKTSALN